MGRIALVPDTSLHSIIIIAGHRYLSHSANGLIDEVGLPEPAGSASLCEEGNEPLQSGPVSGSFHRQFLLANNLHSPGFEQWVFHPAMLFGSLYKWWGDLGRRERPHEGLDMFLYRTKDGSIHPVTAGMKIPAAFEGQVEKVIRDFLAESVFVSHQAHDSKESRLYTMYAHIRPGNGIAAGKKLGEGDIIGVIADTTNSAVVIPPHLHLSVAWVPLAMPASELRWQTMTQVAGLVFLDPLRIIKCPYSITSAGQSF